MRANSGALSEALLSRLVGIASDAAALPEVLKDLHQNERLPETLVADTAYGSDDNDCTSAHYGVELISPVPGKPSEEKASGQVFSENDFPVEHREVVDGYGQTHINPLITACPTGNIPHRSHYDHVHDKMEILNFPETAKPARRWPNVPCDLPADG